MLLSFVCFVRFSLSPSQRDWRWSDQAATYRPPRSVYDRDCGLVIEEFDHTCPWTGTGIGKQNMPYFTVFVTSICVCLVFNIMLMVGVFDPQSHSTTAAP